MFGSSIRTAGVDEVALAALTKNPSFSPASQQNGKNKIVYIVDGILSAWYLGSCVYCQRIHPEGDKDAENTAYEEALVAMVNAEASHSIINPEETGE